MFSAVKTASSKEIIHHLIEIARYKKILKIFLNLNYTTSDKVVYTILIYKTTLLGFRVNLRVKVKLECNI